MTLKALILAAMAGSVAALALSSSAESRDPYAEQVSEQLSFFKRAAIHEGDYSDRGQHVGKLAKGERYERPMTLERGEHYVFAAACDKDCSHVRLRIFDQHNRLIGDMRGRRPSVEVDPHATQQFRIVVDMTGCREEECHFGVTLAAR